MYLKFKSPYKFNLIWTISFTVILIIESIMAYSLLMDKFNPLIYVSFTVGGCVLSFVTFHFLRSLFCPYVQIYDEEIIISAINRVQIPMSKIEFFRQVEGSSLEIKFENKMGKKRLLKLLVNPIDERRLTRWARAHVAFHRS